ncbi:MAG: type II CRISPR-associated endonuclease Cas1 [Bacteroidota bacterium]|nr:MAG: type II CRISPR-associated endonuclease Cas1 [Bacteroidota bacterium]
MIKRTLCFSNPCYLSKKDNQLMFEPADGGEKKTIPIEDIGMLVLDHPQITLSHALLMALIECSAAILSTNAQHMPEGLMLPMTDHHAFTEKVKKQLEASEPLRKNLWQQTVTAKIQNQAALLGVVGIETENMQYWAAQVKSGDPDNYEARAAAFYWDKLFVHIEKFRRHRFGDPPNNLLNYSYAILRAVIARSLVGSGMVGFAGIHHKNKYNPYCLADDVMEPYRPFADRLVLEVLAEEENIEELTPALKRKLLTLPAVDIFIDGQNSPLMVGAQRTTASLMQCFEGVVRKIVYPELS